MCDSMGCPSSSPAVVRHFKLESLKKEDPDKSNQKYLSKVSFEPILTT